MKIIPLISTVLIVGLGVAYAWSAGYLGQKRSNTVRMGFTHETMEAIAIVAEQQGYFKEEGVQVSLIEYATGKEAVERGLLTNEIDIAPAALTPILIASMNGEPVRILASMGFADDQLRIVARKSSGIVKGADLKGKKIATQKGSAAHYFASLYIEKQGLLPKDAAFVFPADVKDLPGLIGSKKVDAVCIKEPISSAAIKALGEDVTLLESRRLLYKTFYYAAKESYIAQNIAPVEKIMRALYKAEQFIQAQNQQSRDLIVASGKFTKEQIEKQWGTTSIVLQLDESLVNLIDSQSLWIIDNKLAKTSTPTNTEMVIDKRILQSVKPQGVLLEQRMLQ